MILFKPGPGWQIDIKTNWHSLDAALHFAWLFPKKEESSPSENNVVWSPSTATARRTDWLPPVNFLSISASRVWEFKRGVKFWAKSQLEKVVGLTSFVIIHVFIASFSPAQGEHNQMVNAKFTRPVNEMPMSDGNDEKRPPPSLRDLLRQQWTLWPETRRDSPLHKWD